MWAGLHLVTLFVIYGTNSERKPLKIYFCLLKRGMVEIVNLW
ncbi:hypothetical protein MMA231_01254 [Asticcacaulis sp. MM231]